MVRLKNRYLVLEVNEAGTTNDSTLKLKSVALYESIARKVQQMHGDFGAAAIRAGFTAKYCNEITRIAIVKVRRGPHKLVTSVLPFIRNIDRKLISINTLYAGATIRQCFQFVRNYQEKKFDEYCITLQTDADKLALKEEMLNFESVMSKI